MKKLFYENTYITSWETKIEKVIEKDNKFYVVLEETAFYPEAGGQPGDKGTIAGIGVLDLIEEEGTIYHVLPTLPSDTLVKCQLDEGRRLDLMQQHTGQHLLSAVFFHEYDGKTSSFHLGEDYISIDISISDITSEMVQRVEEKANKIIYENHPINKFVITKEEIVNYPLRKLPPTDEDIRIVEIQDADFTSCCGTHLNTTGEIGIIKIIRHERYKGITRVYFKCGNRALNDYSLKNEALLNLSKLLNAAEYEIVPRAEAVLAELDSTKKELKELKEQLAYFEALELVKSMDKDLVTKTYSDRDFSDIQLIGKHILSMGNYIVILGSELDNRLLYAKEGNFDINCGKVFKESLKDYNGKGGGNEKQAQGGFATKEDMYNFIKFLKNR